MIPCGFPGPLVSSIMARDIPRSFLMVFTMSIYFLAFVGAVRKVRRATFIRTQSFFHGFAVARGRACILFLFFSCFFLRSLNLHIWKFALSAFFLSRKSKPTPSYIIHDFKYISRDKGMTAFLFRRIFMIFRYKNMGFFQKPP